MLAETLRWGWAVRDDRKRNHTLDVLEEPEKLRRFTLTRENQKNTKSPKQKPGHQSRSAKFALFSLSMRLFPDVDGMGSRMKMASLKSKCAR